MDSSSFQEALDTLVWIFRPIGIIFYYVGLILLAILKLLSGPILAALQPFIYLLYAFYVFVSFPFRLIARLEPVYDYIGAAVIIGGLIGLALNYSFHHFDKYLNLDSFLQHLPGQGRSVQQYRQSKVKKEDMDTVPASPFEYTSLSDSMPSSNRPRKSKNLLDQVIHEEDDSDF